MRSLILLAFAISVFSLGLQGQVCGKYHIRVKVSDSGSHPIKNADVKLSPITTDETRGKQFGRDASDPSTFSVTFTEGDDLLAFHLVTVSAPGFDPAEIKVMFVSCQGCTIEVQLQKARSGEKPVWHFENQLTVEVDGPDGKWAEGATLRITNADTSEVVFDQKMNLGYQSLHLPNGTYLIVLKAADGQMLTSTVDLTVLEDRSLKFKF